MESLPRASEQAGETPGVPWRALAASLALHAGLLTAFAPPSVAPAPPAPPLHAHLRAHETPPPAAAPATPSVAAPRRAVPAPAAPVAVPPAPTFETAVAEPAVAALPPPPVAAEAPRTAMATAAADAQGDALRQYRLALASEARRFRRYPDRAQRAGWTGTVQVRIVVVAPGGTPRAELEESSGHAALDAAALDMLRQAARHAALPEALRGRGFVVLLPVSFEIEE